MEQASKVQALEEDARVAHGASKGCGLTCIVLVALPFLAETRGWVPIKSVMEVWWAAFIANSFFILLITTYLEYWLQPALDRAQNQLILNLRQQIAEIDTQRGSTISVAPDIGNSRPEQRVTQMDSKTIRLERQAGLVNRASFLFGVIALALPWFIAKILVSFRMSRLSSFIVGSMLVWMIVFITAVLFVIYQFFYKPAISRAKCELIDLLQGLIAERHSDPH